MERVARIELASSAWKAEVLPLNYTRQSRPAEKQHRRQTALPTTTFPNEQPNEGYSSN